MFLDELNDSELVLLAQDHDLNAHRALGRDRLYKIILSPDDNELPVRRVNKVRLKIMGYILGHWTQLKPLLSCPARTKKPTACFQCTDTQVSECALGNPQIFTPDKPKGD